MNIEEYEALPDSLNSDEVGSLCMRLINEDAGRYAQGTIEKMDLLCDKQWHTYELPSTAIRKAVGLWVRQYLETVPFDPEVAAKIAYCFGLEKELLAQIVERYGDVDLSEYQEDLEHSNGDLIDPYWTLRGRE